MYAKAKSVMTDKGENDSGGRTIGGLFEKSPPMTPQKLL
jgi:hypothetical protein